MAKFCPDCANPIIDSNMRFCNNCGAKLPITSQEVHTSINQSSAAQQPQQPSGDIPSINTASTSVHTPVPQSQSQTTETTKKKRSMIEWIAIVCGGIILLVILSAFIAGMFSGITKDNYKYCSDNFPGSTYDPSTKMCEHYPQVSSGTSSSVNSIHTVSPGGDQAAVAKMTEMTTWMQPTIEVIGESATSQDMLKMGINAALLRRYIDQNLPEMRQLAAGATTKKSAAQEYVAFLEDLRTSSDMGVRAADKYNSGDINGSSDLLLEGVTYIEKASAHLQQSTALMK